MAAKSLEAMVEACPAAPDTAARLLRNEMYKRIGRELDGGKLTPSELRDLAAAVRHLQAMDL